MVDREQVLGMDISASIDLHFEVTLHVHEGRYSFPTHGLFNSPFKSLNEHGTHIGSEYGEGGMPLLNS